MTITEKAAYLKGLVEGQGLDPEAGEGKLWRVLSELVGDLASELKTLRGEHEDLAQDVEEVGDELEFLEKILQDSLDEFDFDDEDEDDYDEDDGDYYPFGGSSVFSGDDDYDEEDDDSVSYEVECPNCGEIISFSDDVLEQGSIPCPNCDAVLEFTPVDEEDPEDPENGDEPEDDDPGQE